HLHTLALDDIRDTPRAAHTAALARLNAAGARIETFEAPEVLEPMADAGILYTAEAWGTWGGTITAQPEAMFAPIRDRFAAGADHAAADYVAAWQRLDAARATWAARTAGFDAVICPTAPVLPPNVDRLMQDADYYVTENLLALRNTRVGNLMGGCALTLPTGVPSCGMQLIAAPGSERRLLRLGLAVEAVLCGAETVRG
ncbi:MAG: amidase family protein, partial [Paracoccaceae bacterium]